MNIKQTFNCLTITTVTALTIFFIVSQHKKHTVIPDVPHNHSQTGAHDNFDNNECPICSDKFTESFCILKCGHGFHRDCINKWVEICHKNGRECVCPICRRYVKFKN